MRKNRSDDSIASPIEATTIRNDAEDVIECTRASMRQEARQRCAKFAEYAAGNGEPQSTEEWKMYLSGLVMRGDRQIFCRHITRFVATGYGKATGEHSGDLAIIAADCLRLGLTNEASDIINHALALDPNSEPAIFQKAELLEQLEGDREVILELHRKAIALAAQEGDEELGIRLCAGKLRLHGKMKDALDFYRELVTKFPNHKNYFEFAECLNQAGHIEEAKAYQKAIELERTKASAPHIEILSFTDDEERVILAHIGYEPAQNAIRNNKKRN